MIGAREISEILKQYKKHGWTLRRVLLSREKPEDFADLFGTAQIIRAPLDAAWFSRAAKNGEAWELRRLSAAPFALFETFSDDDDEEIREEARREIEERLIDLTEKSFTAETQKHGEKR